MVLGKRRQLFVDAKVQGALMVRTVAYWGFCLIAVTLMLLCWRVFTIPGRTFAFHVDWLWFHYAPAVVASLLLVPIIVIDSLRLSNRFAGPMVRLRRAMRHMAEGENVQPINFRDNDFWSEFAEDFNRMLARQQCLLHEMSDEHFSEDLPALQVAEASQIATHLEDAIEMELALNERLNEQLEHDLDSEPFAHAGDMAEHAHSHR